MSEDVRAAARRLLIEVEIHVADYGCDDSQPGTFNHDIGVVARYALEATDRQAALAAELERVKEALTPMEAWMSHAISVMKDRRLVSLDQIEDGDAILELARAALDPAPAVAPGAEDAEGRN
jgi:hypothetical protein